MKFRNRAIPCSLTSLFNYPASDRTGELFSLQLTGPLLDINVQVADLGAGSPVFACMQMSILVCTPSNLKSRLFCSSLASNKLFQLKINIHDISYLQ
jgi:hypothetical protein